MIQTLQQAKDRKAQQKMKAASQQKSRASKQKVNVLAKP